MLIRCDGHVVLLVDGMVATREPVETSPTSSLLLGVVDDNRVPLEQRPAVAWMPVGAVIQESAGPNMPPARILAVAARSVYQWLRASLSDTDVRSATRALDRQLAEYRTQLPALYPEAAIECIQIRQLFATEAPAATATKPCNTRMHDYLVDGKGNRDPIWSARGTAICTTCARFAALYLPRQCKQYGRPISLWESSHLIILQPLIGLLTTSTASPWARWVGEHILQRVVRTNVDLMRAAPLFLGWLTTVPDLATCLLKCKLARDLSNTPDVMQTLYPKVPLSVWPALAQLAHTGCTGFTDDVWDVVKEIPSYAHYDQLIVRTSVLMRLVVVMRAVHRHNFIVVAVRPPSLTSSTNTTVVGEELLATTPPDLGRISQTLAARPGVRRRITVLYQALAKNTDLDLILGWTRTHEVYLVYSEDHTTTGVHPDVIAHYTNNTELLPCALTYEAMH